MTALLQENRSLKRALLSREAGSANVISADQQIDLPGSDDDADQEATLLDSLPVGMVARRRKSSIVPGAAAGMSLWS